MCRCEDHMTAINAFSTMEMGQQAVVALLHRVLALYSVFLRSDTVATIYFAARFVRLLFEGGIYFFGKPGDIHDGWIR